MTSINQPQWVDRKLYPFQSKFIQLDSGRMHYIDEGAGDPILFVHGTPTWSFLYRDLIKSLSTRNRCIAIDHIGFGLSEKPESFPGKPEYHSKNLVQFIEKLDLRDMTLVVHDFGGPIGLGAGIQLHERIKKLVLFNTWMWSTSDLAEAQKIDRIVNSRIGRLLYLDLNLSPKLLLKKGFADKRNLKKEVHTHYIRPFPKKTARYSLLKLAQSLVGSSDWYSKQWQKLDLLQEKEWLILWGMKDPFLGPEMLDKWTKRLPSANSHQLNCGHFVQEECGTAVVELIEKFTAE